MWRYITRRFSCKNQEILFDHRDQVGLRSLTWRFGRVRTKRFAAWPQRPTPNGVEISDLEIQSSNENRFTVWSRRPSGVEISH